MRIRKLYKYYSFGFNYNNLYDGYRNFQIKSLIDGIDFFMDFIKEMDLKVTSHAVADYLIEIKKEVEKLNKDDNVPPNVFSKLDKFVKTIDKTLDSELQLRDAYVLTEKRLGLEKLTNRVEDLFGDNIFSKLPIICKTDFKEAGMCLAFERYTASAFHILRATEEVLRQYYKTKVKKNRVQNLLWKNITDDLQGRKGIPKSLIAVLDNIREDFRNPTAHPEKNYTEDKVQSLFTHCSDVVNRLVREMKL